MVVSEIPYLLDRTSLAPVLTALGLGLAALGVALGMKPPPVESPAELTARLEREAAAYEKTRASLERYERVAAVIRDVEVIANRKPARKPAAWWKALYQSVREIWDDVRTKNPYWSTPRFASPSIWYFLTVWNRPDHLDPDRLISYIRRAPGSRRSDSTETKRARLFADWLMRHNAPAWLEAAGLRDQATILRQLPPVRDDSWPGPDGPVISGVGKSFRGLNPDEPGEDRFTMVRQRAANLSGSEAAWNAVIVVFGQSDWTKYLLVGEQAARVCAERIARTRSDGEDLVLSTEEALAEEAFAVVDAAYATHD